MAPRTKNSVDLSSCTRIINHGPVVLVSAWDEQNSRQNTMAVAWNSTVNRSPPRVAVVMGKASHTRKLIEETKKFVLNIPSAALEHAVVEVGTCHGDAIDKFEKVDGKMTPVACSVLDKPLLIDECLAHLECKLHTIIQTGEGETAAAMLVGEVIFASADPSVFWDNVYHMDASDDEKTTLHHGGGKLFFKAQ